MVYNTTDNRSSLSITDLTSDGEYSVTVAGRDGTGRLGQESAELNGMVKIIVIHTSFKPSFTVSLAQNISVTTLVNHTVTMGDDKFGILLSWNVRNDKNN